MFFVNMINLYSSDWAYIMLQATSIETYHKAMLETKTKIKFKCSWLRLAIAVTEANCGHAKPFCHVVRPWHLGTFDFISV